MSVAVIDERLILLGLDRLFGDSGNDGDQPYGSLWDDYVAAMQKMWVSPGFHESADHDNFYGSPSDMKIRKQLLLENKIEWAKYNSILKGVYGASYIITIDYTNPYRVITRDEKEVIRLMNASVLPWALDL